MLKQAYQQEVTIRLTEQHQQVWYSIEVRDEVLQSTGVECEPVASRRDVTNTI